MRLFYTIPQVSFYIRIVRIKFQNEAYIKAHIQYFSKPNLKMFSEQKNVKIMKNVMKHWDKEYL